MTEYYIIDRNGNQVGPITEAQFRNHGVTAQTYVWTSGMAEWLPAGRVPALAHLFAQQAPGQQPYQQPYQQQPYQQPYQQPQYQQPQYQQQPCQQPSVCPPTYLAWSIIATLLCCLPFGIVAIVYASKVSGLWAQGRYDEAQRASNTAKNWVIASALTGVAWVIVSFAFGFMSTFLSML